MTKREKRWHAGSINATFIRNIESWVNIDFGKVTYYPTQFLSGHEYFRSYSFKRGKMTTATCKYCGHSKKDAERSSGI